MRIGLALGADVPFFLGGRNAWVEGIGERHRRHWTCRRRGLPWSNRREGLATARIFADPQLKRDSEPAIISGFAANPSGEFGRSPDGQFPYRFGRNDLQPVAQRLCPAVTQALEWLGSQGLEGRMTGSGSAVFARLAPGKALQAAPAGWQVRECGNLEAHPLMGWAPSDDSSVGG